MKYAMFLRGINVGGIKIPMADLKSCLAQAGLDNVTTYLQTGNVIFSSALMVSELKPTMEAVLSKQFGYQAYVHIFSHQSLDRVIKSWPFELTADSHHYAVFCSSRTVIGELLAREMELDPRIEKIAAGSGVIYWCCPKGQSTQTAFSKIIARPRYQSTTTNRNLNTLERMMA